MTLLRNLPPDFLWGVSTAAYQIEGATSADGRGTSIWDTFCKRGGTLHGDNGDIAADHYNRLDEDLALMSDLGITAYRFSIAWPRIQPNGKGRRNNRGLDFYRRLTDGLRQRGIAPVATLYHFDMPQALEDQGGWVARESAQWFADYSAIVAEALGDRVELWITLNEPWAAIWLGYGAGVFAPGRSNFSEAIAATHHMLLGHGLATQAIRQVSPGAKVGITLGMSDIRAATCDERDVAAAKRVEANFNRLFFDPVIGKDYPPGTLDAYSATSADMAVIKGGDLEIIAAPLDFIGLNYYQPRIFTSKSRVAETGILPPKARPSAFEGASVIDDHLDALEICHWDSKMTEMGWTIDAAGLAAVLGLIRKAAPGLPIYITENGAAFHDYVSPEGVVNDPRRIDYLRDHIQMLDSALGSGAKLKGYFAWSLFDNFEWADGYSKRFGLVYLDYRTQKRIPKTSYCWYRDLISRHSLTSAPDDAVQTSRTTQQLEE